jgi:GNAT superfamily N-acetyltransferase
MTIKIEAIESPSHSSFAGAVALLQRFFQEEEFETAPGLIGERAAKMASLEKHWLAVGLADGKLAGVATACLFFTIEAGDFVELEDLYVLPACRNRGVARHLIEAAARWSKSKGANLLEVVVTPAGEKRHKLSRFYAGHGFESTNRTIFIKALNSGETGQIPTHPPKT